MERKYHIVLLGATGYTGKLTIEYMVKNLPGHIKWAIAGRSKGKLEALSKDFKLDYTKCGAVYALDLTSDEEIAKLAKTTRVIINTIGPYATSCGPAVIKACAENGTDYVDCSGEMPWLQDMIEKYDHVAQASGAKIIVTSGWGAVPADLSTYLAATTIRKTFSAPTREILVSLDEIQGGFSGGSINSLCDLVGTYGSKRIAEASSPFTLAPKKRTSREVARHGVLPELNALGVQKVDELGILIASTQEEIERGIIGRSWGLFNEDEGYGKNFFFSSRMRMSNALTAWLFHTFYVFVTSLLVIRPFRTLLAKHLFPAGTGPSAETRQGNHFKYRVIGVADTEDAPKKRVEVKFEYQGDPYVFTGMTLTEAALLLVEGGTEAHRRGGGILTSALLGEKYLERLKRPGLGVKIEVRVLKDN
ncbi:Fc.00g064860.m01.CDS01 [Cosmosporella sp. VM-42]